MSKLKIGYARVSTDAQDLTAQRDALQALGVDPERIYVDHGLTGTHRDRPGLRQALAACRAGDTLVVKLALGTSVHDPTDPVGRLLFNVLAMVAEFEADLIRARTREGMEVARAKGRLRGKQPKLSPMQEAHLGQAIPRRGAHRQRARGALRRHPLDGVPRHAARREERHRTRGRFRERLTPPRSSARTPVADVIPAGRRRVISSTPPFGRRSAGHPPDH